MTAGQIRQSCKRRRLGLGGRSERDTDRGRDRGSRDDIFGPADEDDDLELGSDDDEFDVPSFLK